MERLTTAYERIWADGSAEMQYVANASDLEVVNRLGTYEDAEEEGRLFVVPCKPGDEIYEIVEVEIPVWNCYVNRFIVQDVSAKQVKYSDDWVDWDAPYLYTDEKEAEAKARQLRNQKKRLESGWIPVTERLPENDDYVLMSFENFSLPLVGRYEGDEKLGEIGVDVRMAKRAGLLHDIGKSIDHEVEGSHIQIGADLCKKYKESPLVINAVEAHHGDVEPESLIACIVQAADTISAARPGARRETLETYTNRLKQLEDITNSFKGVDKSFAIQAGREIRIMVVPEQVSDADMVLLARDVAKQIEAELEYPGQIKVSVIRESRAVDYAK